MVELALGTRQVRWVGPRFHVLLSVVWLLACSAERSLPNANSASATGSEQTVGNPSASRATPASPVLIIETATEYGLPVGYGHVWVGHVKRVLKGQLEDREIRLFTRVGDAHFTCCQGHAPIELTLQKVAVRPAALHGFEASDGSIGEILAVRNPQR